MRLQLIQYHCGQMLAALTNNPQVNYHARRIGEVASGDIKLAARRVADKSLIYWRRLTSYL